MGQLFEFLPTTLHQTEGERERGKKEKKRPKNAEASTPDPADDRAANDNVELKMLTSGIV